MNMYDFPCEYCTGTVRERVLDREPINHHRGIVILEKVPIGVCDCCGAHYVAAPVLKRAEAILKATTPPTRTMTVPIETYSN
jgi:YgiT-type zinc finger domain-containing protein